MAVAWIDSAPNTSKSGLDIIDVFRAVHPCCSSVGNIYTTRGDCDAVVCFTNDTTLVENWRNCTASKVCGLQQYASKIDYPYLKAVMNRRTQGIPSASNKIKSVGTMLFVSWAAVALFANIV
jgi:hypothetical protein